MCGISGVFGGGAATERVQAMVRAQRHRGPDSSGFYTDRSGAAALGHNRLSIIDLSDAGRQPMSNAEGNLWISFNGEIYNYVELRSELRSYPYRSQTDTEVILAAFERWGESCLDRLVGMFSFVLWDEREQRLFGARDRFGVKPFHYFVGNRGELLVASEIQALFAAGVDAFHDSTTWATYLCHGLYDHSEATFWEGIRRLPPGHSITWQNGAVQVKRWYDLAERVGPDVDTRSDEDVLEEYLALLRESIRLRFRADVPVGVSLSGGLDSSTLLGLVQDVHGNDGAVTAYTYVTGDSRYDELPWVEEMVRHTAHPLVVCTLRPADIPDLAASVYVHQSEPFGGFPTLAYARLFEEARAHGTVTLMDGNGMDEQWAGYDYYLNPHNGGSNGPVQGTRQPAVRPECLGAEFRTLARPFAPPDVFPDPLRNRQYWDIRYAKLHRALRFNDQVSMRASTELREPFLDHRCLELALRQPTERKIRGNTRKWLVRRIARTLMPGTVAEAPKRPVQTPQREWLQGPLSGWATANIEAALGRWGGSWLDSAAVRGEWARFRATAADNSFFVWQWVSLGLASIEQPVTT